MRDLRGAGGPVRLDSVGGTVLLVNADLHRDGLIFPPFRYGLASPHIRDTHPVWGKGEIETEGFGIMARDMAVSAPGRTWPLQSGPELSGSPRTNPISRGRHTLVRRCA